MHRRRFLRSALTTAALGVGGLWPCSGAGAQAARSRVVVYRDGSLASLDGEAATQRIKALVHVTVQQALRAATPQAAWQSLFRSEDVVAVKLNCMSQPHVPHPAVLEAIVEGLGYANVPPEQVIAYDKEDRDLGSAGYALNRDGPGVRIYGTLGDQRSPGYPDTFTVKGQTSYKLSQIVTTQATAIINVPVVKDHFYAGLTGALKNHFGSIHNPEDFHLINHCDPAIADVNRAGDIQGKQRLVICDARNVQYDGGPSYEPTAMFGYGGIIASTDPVAVDAELEVLLRALREQAGLPSLEEDNRLPVHIKTAADRYLGCADIDQIELVAMDVTSPTAAAG